MTRKARRPLREVIERLKAETKELRGSIKLRAALDGFQIGVADRVCLDVGASTGGFTTVLLERGAKRVYAVDAGHGQLLGSLRQDPRVVNLEATNVGELTHELVPDPIDVVTIDVSYLSLSEAAVHVNRVDVARDADLVGLVKPMFELKLARAPVDLESVDRALALAAKGVTAAGWAVRATMHSRQAGGRGAREGFIHGVRTAR